MPASSLRPERVAGYGVRAPPATMNLNELIGLYFERSNALQSYWTVYVVIIGGLLAFASLRKQRDLLTTALVSVLFCFFAFKNLGAIHDVTMQRFAVLDAIKRSGEVAPGANPARELIVPTLVPPEYEGVRNFHIASDALTLAALWAMERRRKRNADAAGTPAGR